MPARAAVRLIVPGLLGPAADAEAVERLLPSLAATERIIARADQRSDCAAGGEEATLAAFGLDPADAPVAALARQGEGAAPGTAAGYWLRVDPVHLRVDMDHARLFGDFVLALEADEANALVQRLNDRLAPGSSGIEAAAAGRWYLRLDRAPDLATHSLPTVAGRNVNAFLPGGADARAWRSWLTEVQMVLHDAPTNAARERAGRLPVNSVWPWGGGELPAFPHHNVAAAIAADPLTLGAASQAGVPTLDRDEGVAERRWPEGLSVITDFSAREPLVHGEIEGWLEAVERIESGWCAPLLEALRRGRIERLELDPCDGRRFSLGRGGLLRAWRRQRRWVHWLIDT